MTTDILLSAVVRPIPALSVENDIRTKERIKRKPTHNDAIIIPVPIWATSPAISPPVLKTVRINATI
jgi:hypothetical protein